MNIPKTNITMPVFNRHELTLQTIEALIKKTKAPYILTVVNNGSDEPLGKDLLDLHKKGYIHNLFMLEQNYGISCACNIAWRKIDAPFFMKLDNDTEVISDTWLNDIYAMWANFRYKTIFGPIWRCDKEAGKIVTEFGTYWNLPLSFNGTAFIVSAKVRDTIGYFSEDYGLYGEEDADYCLRCHHAGIRKYSYEAKNMLVHRGNDPETYSTRAIDKVALHNQNVGYGKQTGIFALNLFLYKNALRALNVPLKYELQTWQNCYAKVKENPEYAIWHAKLLESLAIFNSDLEEKEKIEKIRAILKN